MAQYIYAKSSKTFALSEIYICFLIGQGALAWIKLQKTEVDEEEEEEEEEEVVDNF